MPLRLNVAFLGVFLALLAAVALHAPNYLLLALMFTLSFILALGVIYVVAVRFAPPR